MTILFSSLLPPQLGHLYEDLLQSTQGLTIGHALIGGGVLLLLLNAKGIPGVWHVRALS
jgi:hypothetical protein